MANKLVLKKGDKVFDSFLFPNQEGVVKEVDDYLIVVDFSGEDYYFPYKDDGDEKLNHFPKTLSLKPYDIVGFEPVCK